MAHDGREKEESRSKVKEQNVQRNNNAPRGGSKIILLLGDILKSLGGAPMPKIGSCRSVFFKLCGANRRYVRSSMKAGSVAP